MEYDKVMDDIISIDKRLRYEYDEINKTIFKGSDRNDLVTVDMTGNFCIEKITFNEEMKDVEKMSDAVKEAFNNAGYEIDYRILNAKNFGVLQSRLRVILIGWKNGSGKRYPEFHEDTSAYTVSDILQDLPPLQAGETNNKYRLGKYSKYLSKAWI